MYSNQQLGAPEDANRLEIDVRKFSSDLLDANPNIDLKDITIAMQCLPLIVGEFLELELTTTDGQTVPWLVFRRDVVTYRFICKMMPLCGDFRVGDVDDEVAVKTTLGWYDIHLDKQPGAKGTPFENYLWMGTETSGFLSGMLVLFFREVEQRRLYPFVVATERDPTKVKNPTKRKKLEAQNNIVVYLGRPPGEVPKATDVSRVPREFGYPRRQHRRTLRAERFKNHPKYGVYKGVLVNQSWCGPTEYVHNRKIYRLWEPPVEDTASG